MIGSDRNDEFFEPARSSLPDQVYTFVIIALALFLLGLAIFRPHYGDITVRSTFGYSRENAPSLDFDAFETQIKDEISESKSLERAMGSIREDLIPDMKGQGWGPMTERLVDQIKVSLKPIDGAQDKCLVQITSNGPNEAFQWQLVNALQQRFEDLHNKPVDLSGVRAKYQEVKDEVASTVGILDFTQKRIDGYIAERLTEERVIHEQRLATMIEKIQEDATRSAPQPSLTPPSPEAPLPIVESVNPNWRHLKDEIERLKKKQANLANLSLDEQAAYGSLGDEISSLESAFSNTPRVVSGSPTAIDNPFVKKDPPQPTMTPQPANRELDLSQLPRFDQDEVRERITRESDFQRLTAKLQESKSTHNAALDKLKATVDPKRVISESVTITQPATVTSRMPGEVTARRACSLLIPSALIGLVCAWFRTSPEPPHTFVSPEDVQEWLDLPVVGAVSTGDGPRIPTLEPPEAPLVVRKARRVAEVTVCVAIALVVLAVITVNNFGQQLIHDPFTAYTQAIAHAGNLFG